VVTIKRAYHHGDLRAAILKAAASEIERDGFETLSLRQLAASIGVAHSAPYRHFVDREALLAALAALGFDELLKRYARCAPSNARRTVACLRPGLSRTGDGSAAALPPLLPPAMSRWKTE
jgi:AcrR family transcriptional regulator